MRCNYPETMKYLASRKARHPREDAIEDMTEWTMTGEPVGDAAPRVGLPGRPDTNPAEAAGQTRKEETREEYVTRRCEEYMHKSLSCRRQPNGNFFTIGGGGDAGQAYQLI